LSSSENHIACISPVSTTMKVGHGPICLPALRTHVVSHVGPYARRWYTQAAEKGNIIAAYNVGLLYDNGRGVPRDLVQAHKWMNLSASLSTGEEREHRVRMRDIIGVKMSYQQIAQARDLALTWRPQRER
jgi:TPR repeat protein